MPCPGRVIAAAVAGSHPNRLPLPDPHASGVENTRMSAHLNRLHDIARGIGTTCEPCKDGQQ